LQCYIVNRWMRHSWASSLERGTISGLYSLVILICISIFSDDPIMHMHTSCSLWAYRVDGSTWTALPHVGALCWFYIFQSLMICYISVWKVVTKKDSIRYSETYIWLTIKFPFLWLQSKHKEANRSWYRCRAMYSTSRWGEES
jgi:hypothetical protein